MHNFILITNAYKDSEFRFSKEIISYIEAKGGKAKCLVSNIKNHTVEDFSLEEIPLDTDCIFVLGGDGTLIRAATKVKDLGIPLIGVNLGTLGYLCELEQTTVFSAIDRLFLDDYTIEERMMLSGHARGEAFDKAAMNDVVIRTRDMSILSLHIYVNGELLSNYHADGVIIATPTGSTGYNMSAGGPIVDPKAMILLMTPINAHNLNSKSIVLGGDDVVEIELGPRRHEKDEQADVCFDGDKCMTLSVGDRITITRANRVTKICKLNNKSYLELLRKKMETYT